MNANMQEIEYELDRREKVIIKLLTAAKLANIVLLQQKHYSDADNEAMDILQLVISEVEHG